MFKPNPLGYSDGYKPGHKRMLAPNTDFLYGTWIPRSLKHAPKGIKKVVSIGQQLTWKWLHDVFEEYFFKVELDKAMQFGRDLSKYIGSEYNYEHFEKLHDLGYLPLRVKALPEGIETGVNIPHMTFINTVKGFAWLVLYLETPVSDSSWQMPTSATQALQFKRVTHKWLIKTDSSSLPMLDYLCHDFASRGMGGSDVMLRSGLGHAALFRGSDTLICIEAARYYYNEPEDEVCINSVNASEHSVTCTGIFYYMNLLKSGKLDHEIKRYYDFDVPAEGSIDKPDYKAIAEWLNLEAWLKEFPEGILSIVADTFNLWKLITFILPRLKQIIMNRNGKVVIRPDSGDPVDIICGTVKVVNKPNADISEDYQLCDGRYYERKFERVSNHRHEPYVEVIEKDEIPNKAKGVIELLYDIFGGSRSDEGYIRLDSHIGAIYGDSINLERQLAIFERLAAKGFAASNIILGIGSFTYRFVTRDTFGYAAKGAWFECEGKGYNIYKEPITDDGTKTSLKGRCAVHIDDSDEYVVKTECTEAEERQGELQIIYENGYFLNQTSLTQIRERLNSVL